MIDRKYDDDNFNHYNYKEIIVNEIEEVKVDYFKAVKKSIIDYILLEQAERDRLNVQYIPNPVPFYGEIVPHYQAYDPRSLYLASKTTIE